MSESTSSARAPQNEATSTAPAEAEAHDVAADEKASESTSSARAPIADEPKPPAPVETRTVEAWAVANKLSVPTDPVKRTGDFYTHSPAKLEGAIGLRVAQKKWPARRAEVVTEADFDAAIQEFEAITLG